MNNLDKYDLAILQELQADARLTNAELAQRLIDLLDALPPLYVEIVKEAAQRLIEQGD